MTALLVCCLACSWNRPACGETRDVPPASGVAERPSVLRFVEEADWPPFTSSANGFATNGLSFELMQAVCGRLGVRFTIALYPQKRMMELLKTGEADAATAVSINVDRARYLEFSSPLCSKNGLVYYVSHQRPTFNWSSYADWKGLRIGITAGHNYGDGFSEAMRQNQLQPVEVTREEQGYDMLLAGRLDLFLGVDLTAGQLLREPRFKGMIGHAEKPYYTGSYHIAMSRKSAAMVLMPEINDCIRQLQADGILERIQAGYRE